MRLVATLIFVARLLPAADSIPAAQAKDHVGESATVCGKVADTRYLDSSQRQPTFLNFGNPYPKHTFTAVIFGPDRAKFGKPEETYRDKEICVNGKIENYNAKPQIVVNDPKQITTP
jgi:hypothetical protein